MLECLSHHLIAFLCMMSNALYDRQQNQDSQQIRRHLGLDAHAFLLYQMTHPLVGFLKPTSAIVKELL